MDTSDPDIFFDKAGVCNHCHHHDKAEATMVFKGEAGEKKLAEIVSKIKQDGIGKEYDCIIGLSGGVDSTYVALLVKQHGLRPLAVHLDNGWNSELAVKNVENIVKELNLDLFTIVINWEEFKDLQLAYFRSGVIDLEATSDHAIFATMYKLAKDYNIRYVVNGTNILTESIMPESWFYRQKDDLVNLKDIHKKFGSGVPLKTFPTLGFVKSMYFNLVHKMQWVSILNFVPYIKPDIKAIIKKELDWNDYGGKHHESIITKFYQSYILPEKYGVDKRRAHLSNLVCAGQLSREEAIKEIETPVYKTKGELENDIEYVIKKFGISREEFDSIMTQQPRKHTDFKTDKWQRDLFFSFVKNVNKIRGKKS
jgi:N-acetyl sugar amidotransferase